MRPKWGDIGDPEPDEDSPGDCFGDGKCVAADMNSEKVEKLVHSFKRD